MAEEYKKSRIIDKQVLDNGDVQITFAVNPNDIVKYFPQVEYDKEYELKPTEEGFKIGKGSVKSRYTPFSSSGYTSNDSPYTLALKVPEDPHKKIELAVELYHKEPIVGTVIDLMVDFSASGFNNDCEDEKIKKLYDEWCKKIKMADLVEAIFLEYYRSGNVTIYRSDKKAKVKKKTKNTKKKRREH